MFLAAQLLQFALEPLFWVMALLLAGLLCMRHQPRVGRRLVWTAWLALVLSGWTAVPEILLRNMETRYPQVDPHADLKHYNGIVVLGGALSPSELWTSHNNQVALNGYAERMTEAVALMRRYPHLKMLFTGGISTPLQEGLTESQRARIFFDQMGVDGSRVVYESRSQTTAQNAILSAAVPGIDKTQPWLLVTSAFHQPRAMGAFQKVGWNVTAYPVDYHSDDESSWFSYSLRYGPEQWYLAMHELIGYYAYRLAGKI